MSKRERDLNDEDLEDELEKQWEMQDQINPSCKMRDKSKIFKD